MGHWYLNQDGSHATTWFHATVGDRVYWTLRSARNLAAAYRPEGIP